ncbi:MAG: ammonia channel protein, partial [Pseudomonadota bacterium]
MKTRLALLAVLALLPALAFAADAKPTLNSGDTAWMLTSTALVLFMTLPGLALFYAGLVRSKNVLSVLMQCFAITAMISIVWALVGYSIAFGDGGAQNAWWGGLGKAFLDGVGAGTIKDTIPESVFVMFQMTFAIITPALVVGGFAERMKFSAMMWFSLLWVLLVYLPVCHWVWAPGGWLQKMGALDFAGGTVVHVASGCAGLAAALILKKRRGFPGSLMVPHNLPFTLLGAGLLW